MAKWFESPEIVADFKGWVKERFTSVQIAQMLHEKHGETVTRNSILGFAFRKGLSIGGGVAGRRPYAKATKMPPPEATPVIPQKRPEVDRIVVASRPRQIARGPIIPSAPSRLPVVKLAPKPQAPPPEPTGRLIDLFPDPEGGIVLPRWDTCRWIEGDPVGGPAKMCGDLKEGGSSYCGAHRLRSRGASVPLDQRKKEKARF